MAQQTTVILPVRDFHGMTRLVSVLSASERSALIRELCDRAAAAALGAGLRTVVVSSSSDVLSWAARRGLDSFPDPGEGLSRAAHEAVASLGDTPWIVLHTDLPMVSSRRLAQVAKVPVGRPVLVPSHDGGTNVVASTGRFPFSYGGGSFHRHFSAVPDAAIISNTELSIDIDGPAQLVAFPHLVEAVGSNHGIEPL